MDTRKLTLETFACSCEGGTEYGLVIKDTNHELTEGEDVLFDIVTHERQLPAPRSEAEAYNANGQQDAAAELVRRWNAHLDLMDKLTKILGHIKSSIDTEDDAFLLDLKTCDECGPDAIRELLQTLKA